MLIISHRRNTVEQLHSTPTKFGVEIDVRSEAERLILAHDPFSQGTEITEWLTHFRHETLILNVKEEGLEPRLIELMETFQVKDYFFLDQSFPFLLKFARQRISRAAVRISEFESIETARAVQGLVDWVWVDSFKHLSFSATELSELQERGFKLCLVSPELQGREPLAEVMQWRSEFGSAGLLPNAVCTKHPEIWETWE